MLLESPNLTLKYFTMTLGNAFISGSKCQVKVTHNKNSYSEDFGTLVSAAILWLLLQQMCIH